MSAREPQCVDRRRPPSGCIAALLLALLPCGGCWEEIRYMPSAEKPDAPVAGDASADTADAVVEGDLDAASAPLPDAQAPAEQASPPPSTRELFTSEESGAEAPPTAEDGPQPASDKIGGANGGPASILPTPPAPEIADDAVVGDETAPTAAAAPAPAERLQAWQAASKWSLAAAIYAKGLPNAPEEPILAEATEAAEELGLELPALPTVSRDYNRQAAVIEGLRGELAVAVRNAYANRFGEAEAAAAELAIRSHLLLLVYSPRNADAAMEAEGLRRAGEASGLPAELWTPLAALVEQRAPYLEVRQTVFDLHRRVDGYLSEIAESGAIQ